MTFWLRGPPRRSAQEPQVTPLSGTASRSYGDSLLDSRASRRCERDRINCHRNLAQSHRPRPWHDLACQLAIRAPSAQCLIKLGKC
jgi:hypothetical protein